NKLDYYKIAGDVLGLPGGSGQGVAVDTFREKTYIGVFPIIEAGLDVFAQLFGGDDDHPSDLVSPISYGGIINAYSEMANNITDIIGISLKKVDDLTSKYSYNATKMLDGFITF